MDRINPYQSGLEKNAANFVALSPLSFIERTARIYPQRTAIVAMTGNVSEHALARECGMDDFLAKRASSLEAGGNLLLRLFLR